jgi:hypothetical protein
MTSEAVAPSLLFNSAVETGLRALSILTAGYPTPYALQRLVIADYLLVHSDDVPGGPPGLHPQTPHRSGEMLVRRGIVQEGLLLYQSRGLVERLYRGGGLSFVATELAAGFLDSLDSEYAKGLRERAQWIQDRFGATGDTELETLVREHLGTWGAEFALQSVLWAEEAQ